MGEQYIEPLLYIDQPTLQKPKAYMQGDYKGFKQARMPENNKKNPVQRSSMHETEDSFTQLSIDEKIKYLINLPSEVPKLKCSIKLQSTEYEGTIIEEDEETIILQRFGREDKQIRKKDIKSIHLLGF